MGVYERFQWDEADIRGCECDLNQPGICNEAAREILEQVHARSKRSKVAIDVLGQLEYMNDTINLSQTKSWEDIARSCEGNVVEYVVELERQIRAELGNYFLGKSQVQGCGMH